MGKSALVRQHARSFAHDHRGGVFTFDMGGSSGSDATLAMARYDIGLRRVATVLAIDHEHLVGSKIVAESNRLSVGTSGVRGTGWQDD